MRWAAGGEAGGTCPLLSAAHANLSDSSSLCKRVLYLQRAQGDLSAEELSFRLSAAIPLFAA